MLGTVVPEPYAAGISGGMFSRLRFRLSDRASWRDLAWLLEVQTIGFAMELAALIAFPFLPLGWWGSPLLLRTDAVHHPAADRAAGRPAAGTDRRAGDLPRATVDHSAAELRRIERDLHDGAQAQLVALAMTLGLAQELVEPRPGRRGRADRRGPRVVDDRAAESAARWSAGSIRRCSPTAG